jgi:putative tryptophan/tyrosine transport system substrate-binding protein
MLDVRRRHFIRLLGGAVATWPLAARAQQPAGQFHRVGILHSGTEASVARYLATFRDGMRQLGYVEGRNIHYDYRFDDGYLDRLTALAAETVRRNPSLIVSAPLPANLAAKQATTTIPIVMATGADPVKFGLVTSLSHPGGNLTGLTNFSEVLASKQIDLLRDLMPRLSRLGVLVSTSNPLHAPQLRDIEQATNEAGLLLMPFEVPRPEALDSAFAAMARKRLDALLVPPDIIFFSYRPRIAELSAMIRLPAIYGYREHVEDGGLMSYGPDLRENWRRAPIFVDKILRGARPADLPIERVTMIELLINLKTAKALGLDVPPTLLARADEVIE